jgi:carboxypeptidase Taq
MSSTTRFQAEMARVNDVLCAINILNWDARTQMPAPGAAARGQQIATLTDLARSLLVGEEMRTVLAEAEEATADAPDGDLRRRAVAQARNAIATLERIPARLIGEAAELKTVAQAAWAAARSANDFAAFAPYLERTFAIQRKIAEAIGYDDHPYDAMIGQYEPGMTWARLQRLYAELRAGLRPLIEAAASRPAPRMDFLARAYPVEQQKAFARGIAARMGYDFSRGRLDDTVHPFEISFSRSDVRITSRFRETWLPGGLFAVWHEAGHGMYEQGIDPAFTRSIFASDLINLYAVGGTSFGMHESQSRLWENRVGRSRRFWELHFPALAAAFPDQLADVTAEEFWRAVNVVRPSLIRVEADELTYDLHIMLRSEIEAEIMAGAIQARDLPAVWAEKMTAALGLEVPDDAMGVLQDVHWASGYVGSFPTYTLGNIMASQLFSMAETEPAIAGGLDSGDYAPLCAWLNDKVHRHGRSLSADEILRDVTGRPLDAAPYLAYLQAKSAALS